MTALTTFQRYLASLEAGDMAALADTFDPEVIWHQPGTHPLSGDHVGVGGVMSVLGGMMERSAGTLIVATVDSIAAGNLVTATVRFTAQREGRDALDQYGVDTFRIENDRIAEVWLNSENQAAEDLFWA